MYVEQESYEHIGDQKQNQSQHRIKKSDDGCLPACACPEIGHQWVIGHLPFRVLVIEKPGPDLQENRHEPQDDKNIVQLQCEDL